MARAGVSGRFVVFVSWMEDRGPTGLKHYYYRQDYPSEDLAKTVRHHVQMARRTQQEAADDLADVAHDASALLGGQQNPLEE